MNYIRKGTLEIDNITPEQLAQYTFEAELAEKDTVIDTAYGDVLVSKGNYILTDHNGSKVCITPVDLANQYDKED